MNATDLLKRQHRKVDALFAKFEKAKKAADKATIFQEIAASLVAHDAIERELFYPACEAEMGMSETLGEALVEHDTIERMLYRADQNLENDTLDHHVKMLKEVVEHHVQEEEEQLFPEVEEAFEADDLEDLGFRMQARFDEAIEEDYREALHDLPQVVETPEPPTQRRAHA